jgi:hypothetical protein
LNPVQCFFFGGGMPDVAMTFKGIRQSPGVDLFVLHQEYVYRCLW